ncbi:MAG: M1 family metallopeptidase [Chitinophagaceae bacterium]|nr:M1 family metallopeptidase [Chitinophagaceae bacterium]
MILLTAGVPVTAQTIVLQKFTRADTLRGMLSALRSCYDVSFYDLDIKVDVKRHSISGKNTISYNVVEDFDSLQIDLFAKMKIEKITYNNMELKFRREFNAVMVKFPEQQKKGGSGAITCYYSGMPMIAKSPPWDGGFVWKKDAHGLDWVGVSCEGTGASLWWPCKDHLSDEPDSMSLTFTVPDGLMCVANGTLRSDKRNADGTVTWKWFVSYPINNYNVTFNLANYSHWQDVYVHDNDTLPLDYYVLADNVAQAKTHFEQVKLMLACFEYYFGPYPFPKDGYALVETNYWGMEHQGAIAYGNNYQNNKQGFDYIIIHESAHEWWGNNVTCNDVAELWIHESFAAYSEPLYLECTQGKEAAVKYLVDHRWSISDKYPIIGPYGVNFQGTENDNDMYDKGSWMLHTFRNVLNNDTLFFYILKNIQLHFKLQNISTHELIAYINELAGKNYTFFFDQYLRYPSPPVLEYRTRQKGKDTRLEYRWRTDVKPFNMPLEITDSYQYNFGVVSKTYERIYPTNSWQTLTIHDFDAANFDVNTDLFYVKKREVK